MIPAFDAYASPLMKGDFTKTLAGWVVEGTALPDLGMPDVSFTLSLDSSPLPAEAAGIFNSIIQACTMEVVMDNSLFLVMVNNNEPWLERRAIN